MGRIYFPNGFGEFSDYGHINVGVSKDITIHQLATIISEVVGYNGDIVWDHNKPNGTPRKLLDSTMAHKLGWTPKTDLKEGIQKTYEWFIGGIGK